MASPSLELRSPVPARLAYKVPEVAQMLGLCRATVYNMIARGELTGVRIGGVIRVPAAELERVVGGDAA